MHPIHDPAVGAEDDRVLRIDILNQVDVIDDRSNGRTTESVVEPVDGVDLLDRVETDIHDRQLGRQLDKPVNVPSIKPISTRPEVVLLPHGISLSANES